MLLRGVFPLEVLKASENLSTDGARPALLRSAKAVLLYVYIEERVIEELFR